MRAPVAMRSLTLIPIALIACGHRREEAPAREVLPPPPPPPPSRPSAPPSPPPTTAFSDEDRAVLAPALALMERAGRTSDTAELSRLALEAAAAYVPALKEVAKRHPGDFAVQYEVAKALEMLGPQIEGLGGDGKPACTEAVAFTRGLVARFGGEPRAHGVHAFAMSNCDQDPQEILVAAARCEELPSCRDLHARTAGYWQAPRCAGTTIAPGVRVFGAGPQGADREATPAITAADFLEIVRVGDGSAVGTLNPAGHGRLRALTARLAATHGSVVIVAGAEVLATLEVTQEITHPRVDFITRDIEKVCASVERRPLPAAAVLRTGSK